MAKPKLEYRLPQTRVSEDLYRKVLAVAEAQDISLADVQRAALEEYCTPADKKIVRVPIIGKIVPNPRGTGVLFVPTEKAA